MLPAGQLLVVAGEVGLDAGLFSAGETSEKKMLETVRCRFQPQTFQLNKKRNGLFAF